MELEAENQLLTHKYFIVNCKIQIDGTMRTGLIIGGVVVVIVGFFFTLTIIGALIGLPFMLVGGIMMLVGIFSSGKKREQIIVSQQVNYPDKVQIRCLNCNTLNSEDAKYCSKCGAELKK